MWFMSKKGHERSWDEEPSVEDRLDLLEKEIEILKCDHPIESRKIADVAVHWVSSSGVFFGKLEECGKCGEHFGMADEKREKKILKLKLKELGG